MELKHRTVRILLFGAILALKASCITEESTVPAEYTTIIVPSQSSDAATKTSSTPSSVATSTTTTAKSSVTSSSQPTRSTTTITTTDVCGLSLVSLTEESTAKLQKCRCSNDDEYVDCSNLDVSELPKLISFPKSARNVNFLGNHIENIAEDTFYNGRNVLELDLSHNRIDFISSVAFKAFKNLRELDLSHNKIWNMPSKSFQGMTQLRYLNLGYNDLAIISSDLFSQTTGLKELILESNPLKEVEPKLFEHLPNLEVLNLESTLLRVIPDHLFYFTPHLNILDLSNNQLYYVPTTALKVLDRLKVLEMSGNPIPTVEQEAFFGLRNLVILYLDRMPVLTTVEKYAFGDMLQLQELHCSYNFMLTEFDGSAFVRKTDNSKVSPSQLFLRQNSLETLSKDLLNWNEKMELHINDNPLYCDCNVEWMVNLKLKNEFQTQAKCFGPSYLSDVALSQLKDHNLSCGLNLAEVVTIAIAVVISIIILVLIIAFLIWKRTFSGYTRPYFKVRRKNMEDIDYSI